ncbi:hypothetical protein [Streptosporangium canum]|uniref:hypothetical protein n=1 Tax=Streptosporangium canum TaxID=324952 RepID=UPI0037938DFF
MMHALGGMVRILGEAEPARKTKIYAGSGLTLTYYPENQKGADQLKSRPAPHR